jgi:hypothetical protein
MRKLGRYLILGAIGFLIGCNSVNSSHVVPIQPSPLTVTTTSLPNGTVGTAYSGAVSASGGTTPYTYSASNLPSGLAINSSTGAITGTPPSNSVGTAAVTVTVTDSTLPSSAVGDIQPEHYRNPDPNRVNVQHDEHGQ